MRRWSRTQRSTSPRMMRKKLEANNSSLENYVVYNYNMSSKTMKELEGLCNPIIANMYQGAGAVTWLVLGWRMMLHRLLMVLAPKIEEVG
jgi:hypothetical protein